MIADRLRPSSLTKPKRNLYFEKDFILNNEDCSLLIEIIPTTWTLKFYYEICHVLVMISNQGKTIMKWGEVA